MNARLIQSRTLPDDWEEKVKNFDIDNSSLSMVEKEIVKNLLQYANYNNNTLLYDQLRQSLIKHIIFQSSFLPANYNNVPVDLINNAMNELKGEAGLNFSIRLHSIFIEFLTYQELCNWGYQIVSSKRQQSSCDLMLNKDNIQYNCEVKFKQNPEITMSKLYDILDGFSLLQSNSFLRGKLFTINIIDENTNLIKEQGKILDEINQFISKKQEVFNGQYIKIAPPNKMLPLNKDINASCAYVKKFVFSDDFQDQDKIESKIESLFIGNGRHITKLAEKSKKNYNFIGCLTWVIPFHNHIDLSKIKIAFQNIHQKHNLNFKLYVFVVQTGSNEKHSFLLLCDGKIVEPLL